MHVLIHHCINDRAAGEEAAAAAILLLIPHEHTILSAPQNTPPCHVASFLLIRIRAAADELLSGSPAEEEELDPSAASLTAEMLMT